MNGLRFATFMAVLGLVSTQAASAQTVSIVAGNGQAVCPGCPGTATGFFNSLVVKVTDSNGAPMSGVAVNWTTTGGALLASQTFTDANGMTTNTLTITNIVRTNVFQSYVQYTVTAQAGSSAATFYLTQGYSDPFNTFASAFQPYGIDVPVGQTLTGHVGAPSNVTIKVGIRDEFGNAIPNVALSLVNNQDASEGATVQCASTPPGAGVNVALSDASGIATCNVNFLSPGRGQFTALLGAAYPGGDLTQTPKGIYNSLPINLDVQPGTAGTLTVISGSSQAATVGQAVTLVAEVDSAANQPLAGVPVTWKVTPANSAILSSATSTSDANGRVSIAVTPSTTGTITVTASLTSDSTKTATFTLTVGQPLQITGFVITSGNNQSAPINAYVRPAADRAGRHQRRIQRQHPGDVQCRQRVGLALRHLRHHEQHRAGAGNRHRRQRHRTGHRHRCRGRQ